MRQLLSFYSLTAHAMFTLLSKDICRLWRQTHAHTFKPQSHPRTCHFYSETRKGRSVEFETTGAPRQKREDCTQQGCQRHGLLWSDQHPKNTDRGCDSCGKVQSSLVDPSRPLFSEEVGTSEIIPRIGCFWGFVAPKHCNDNGARQLIRLPRAQLCESAGVRLCHWGRQTFFSASVEPCL